MELYVLDDLFRPSRVIDTYESLIWSERFSETGDFELTLQYSLTHKQTIKVGTMFMLNESERVMIVEMVEDRFNDDGKKVLKIKGSSLETILKDRIAMGSLAPLNASDGTDKKTWRVTGTPGAILRKLFHDICVTGILDPKDRILDVVEIATPNFGAMEEPKDSITMDLDIATLYDSLKEVADVWGFGFKLTYSRTAKRLEWQVYTGRDLSTSQTKNTPVLFTPELDNLTDVSEVNSIVGSKNVAYVFGADAFVVVYPEGVPPDTDGFDRRVLHVLADNISASNTTDVKTALIQLGKSELAKLRSVQAFDGEVRQDSQYKYGKHYQLGDLVELRNMDGESNRMRVSEQIFVSDKNGVRSYPTLEMYQYVNAGSWLSWISNQTWLDYDNKTTTWSELP